jgi:hypothetical protein
MRFPITAMGVVALSRLLLLSVPAQNLSEAIKVVGIVDLLDYRCALLQRLDRQTPFGEHLMLKEGERERDVTVIEINLQERSLRVDFRSHTNVTLRMSDLPSDVIGAPHKNTVTLKEISLHPLLNLYSQFSGRTILRHPLLSPQTFTLSAAPANQAEAAAILDKALAEREIVSIMDGEKFMMVVPKLEEKNVRPASAELKQASVIPPGVIDFRDVDVASATLLYCDLAGGKVDRENLMTLRGVPIVLKTQTTMTTAQAIYALDTLFGWQGLKAIRSDDGTIRLELIKGK